MKPPRFPQGSTITSAIRSPFAIYAYLDPASSIQLPSDRRPDFYPLAAHFLLFRGGSLLSYDLELPLRRHEISRSRLIRSSCIIRSSSTLSSIPNNTILKRLLVPYGFPFLIPRASVLILLIQRNQLIRSADATRLRVISSHDRERLCRTRFLRGLPGDTGNCGRHVSASCFLETNPRRSKSRSSNLQKAGPAGKVGLQPLIPSFSHRYRFGLAP